MARSNLEGVRPQMTRQLVLPIMMRGEAPRSDRSAETPTAAKGSGHPGTSELMERVLSRPNLKAALKRVRKNKGGPGIDGMTVEDLPPYLREHWPRLREELLAILHDPARLTDLIRERFLHVLDEVEDLLAVQQRR